jgi:class 3 adenylate cyclase/putative methionine-R-sulfoxide reductase with GAF domain
VSAFDPKRTSLPWRKSADLPRIEHRREPGVGADMQRRGEGRQPVKGQRQRTKPKARKVPTARASNAHRDELLDQHTRERNEALEQLAATSEVLKAISRSTFDLQSVLEWLLEKAVHLSGADRGFIFTQDGDVYRIAASYGHSAEFNEFVKQNPIRQDRRSATGRAVVKRGVVHIVDILEDSEYRWAEDLKGEHKEEEMHRTILAVPMLKENTIVGVITIRCVRVRPFTERQIELVKNFAAQAVIAIENTRLLSELRQSLEQQTATSEVLSIISSSPAELEPVFQAILANATRLCDAKFGTLGLYDGEAFRSAALYNVPPEYAEARQRQPVWRPPPRSGTAKMARTKQPVQIEDLRTSPGYMEGDSTIRATVDVGGARTLLLVPMLKDDALVGLIGIYRKEVQPFTDKEVALVQNFAAQAVIAIENARLLNDLNKLNQQLEQRVEDQVSEIERMSRLRRFLPPQVADLIIASGTEKRLESHRREITALFCDLRGFTGFSEKSDPEDVMSLLREYHAAIGEIIIKYSGTLEHYAGDGVMVFFNDPIPVPNPALQAVRTALDMRMAIESLTGKWRRLGHELGFGVGIAHGFATLGTIGFEGRFDYAAVGTVSNVASRLCDEAKPGQILISPRVLMAVEDAVNVEPVGDFTLKGISRPVAAYNVLSAVSSKI